MKSVSFSDLDKLQLKIEKIESQFDVVRRFIEKKMDCSLLDAAAYYDYDNPLISELLALEGSIQGVLENIYNL